MEMNDSRSTWKYSLFYVFYFAAQAIYQGYISKYYQMTGATNAQISILLAAAPIVTILAQPIWGMLGDRSQNRNKVLRWMVLLAVIFMAMLPLSQHFAWMLVISALFPACYTAIQPMGDSIILEDLTARGRNFGPLRMTGCVSYALVNLLLGYVLGERFLWVVILSSAALSLVFAATFALPSVPGHQRSGERMSMADLFRIKGMPVLLTLFMLLHLCLGYFNSFFTIHFTSLPGGTTALLGLAYFLSAISEIPFLLRSDSLFERFGAGRLLSLAALTTALRFFAVALSRSVVAVLFSQLLHGLNYVVIMVSMAKYINAAVPAQLRSSGQMLITILGYGVARVFGILGGGLMSDLLGGTQQIFLTLAFVAAATFLCFAQYYLRKPPLNGRENA